MAHSEVLQKTFGIDGMFKRQERLYQETSHEVQCNIMSPRYVALEKGNNFQIIESSRGLGCYSRQ